MSWVASDVERHNKGLTQHQKEVWVHVANRARERCIEKGGSESHCDASAIRQANAVVARMQEVAPGTGQGVGNPPQGTGGTDVCTCPKCGHKFPHKRGVPCQEVRCPKCGVPMTGVSSKNTESAFIAKFEARDVPEIRVEFKEFCARWGIDPELLIQEAPEQ